MGEGGSFSAHLHLILWGIRGVGREGGGGGVGRAVGGVVAPSSIGGEGRAPFGGGFEEFPPTNPSHDAVVEEGRDEAEGENPHRDPVVDEAVEPVSLPYGVFFSVFHNHVDQKEQ